MTTITQADRIAAASVAVLPEMRELILAGRADHHAEPFARHREAERDAIVAWVRVGANVDPKALERLDANSRRMFDKGNALLADAIKTGAHLK